MAKSKYSPALFEVINRQRNTGKMGVPKWWKGLRAEDKQATGSEDTGPSQQVPAQAVASDELAGVENGLFAAEVPVTQGPELMQAPSAPGSVQHEAAAAVECTACEPSGSQAPADVEEAGLQGPPMFRVEGGRAWISLNLVQGCVIGGLLLVALIASFELGRGLSGSGKEKPGTDALAEALKQAPNPSVLESPGSAGKTAPARSGPGNAAVAARAEASPPPPAAQDDPLQPGLYYVLLDRYPRDRRKTAEHVQKWLASVHNIQTVLRLRESDYVLIARTGFTERGPADELRDKIKALGRDCRNELIKADLPVYNLASPLVFKLENK